MSPSILYLRRRKQPLFIQLKRSPYKKKVIFYACRSFCEVPRYGKQSNYLLFCVTLLKLCNTCEQFFEGLLSELCCKKLNWDVCGIWFTFFALVPRGKYIKNLVCIGFGVNYFKGMRKMPRVNWQSQNANYKYIKKNCETVD